MSYGVHEIFYTLQCEGVHAGRPAVFCRFCDHERAGRPVAHFDSAQALARQVAARWPGAEAQRFVVLAGGEPLRQVDEALVEALHGECFEVAFETDGSIVAPAGLDWICVSPRPGLDWVQTVGDELKLLFPQPGLMPDAVRAAHFAHWLLQPLDGPRLCEHTRAALDWCLAHPRWRLSMRLHHVLQMPPWAAPTTRRRPTSATEAALDDKAR